MVRNKEIHFKTIHEGRCPRQEILEEKWWLEDNEEQLKKKSSEIGKKKAYIEKVMAESKRES